MDSVKFTTKREREKVQRTAKLPSGTCCILCRLSCSHSAGVPCVASASAIFLAATVHEFPTCLCDFKSLQPQRRSSLQACLASASASFLLTTVQEFPTSLCGFSLCSLSCSHSAGVPYKPVWLQPLHPFFLTTVHEFPTSVVSASASFLAATANESLTSLHGFR